MKVLDLRFNPPTLRPVPFLLRVDQLSNRTIQRHSRSRLPFIGELRDVLRLEVGGNLELAASLRAQPGTIGRFCDAAGTPDTKDRKSIDHSSPTKRLPRFDSLSPSVDALSPIFQRTTISYPSFLPLKLSSSL